MRQQEIIFGLKARRDVAVAADEQRRVDFEPVGRKPLDSDDAERPRRVRLEIAAHARLKVEIARDRPRPQRLQFGFLECVRLEIIFDLGFHPQPVPVGSPPALAVEQEKRRSFIGLIFEAVAENEILESAAVLRVERAPRPGLSIWIEIGVGLRSGDAGLLRHCRRRGGEERDTGEKSGDLD